MLTKTFTLQARQILVGLLILAVIFFAIWNFFPKTIHKEIPVEKVIYLTPEQTTDPILIQKEINQKYDIAAEVSRDIQKAKPTDKPEPKPDQIIRVYEPVTLPVVQSEKGSSGAIQTVNQTVKQFNLVYDRPLGIGVEYTNRFKGLEVEYKPEHWLGVEAKAGKLNNGEKYYGIGVKFWFK